MEKKVWLITGVSKGLGKHMAELLLAQGDIVVGTVRSKEDQQLFKDELGGDAYIIDLKNLDEIAGLIKYVIQTYGKLDVLVNNAGYGAFGMVEEFSIKEVREQMEVNFFAVLALCQAVLPHFRTRKSGTIVQLSSRLGISSGIGKGIYSAGKFAIEGLSEALRAEVKPFGIRVLLMEPGAMRTDFFGKSIAYAETIIKPYQEEFGDLRTNTNAIHGNQPGDPNKVAKEIIKAVNNNQQDLFRLPFTTGSLETIADKIKEYQLMLEEYSAIGRSVEFKS